MDIFDDIEIIDKQSSKERNIQKLAVNFIKEPNDKTFGALYKRIKWGLRSYIYNIVKDDNATDEIESVTLENIYYKRDQFDAERGNFSTWMYRIAYNNTLKYIDRLHAKRQLVINEDYENIYDSEKTGKTDETSSQCPASNITVTDMDLICINGKMETYTHKRIMEEMYDASVSCIEYLPDNLKTVMYDRLINNKKIDAIAADNNMPVSSVKNWIRKGKEVLQEAVKEHYTYLFEMFQNSLEIN